MTNLSERGAIATRSQQGAHYPIPTETKSGELCLISGSHSAGRFLIRFDDEKGPLTIRPNLPKRLTYFGWGWSQFGLQDREGEWWIPTGHELFRFPKVSRVEQLAYMHPKANYTTRNGLIAEGVWRIYEDSRGDIWIGTASQVWVGVNQSGPTCPI